MGSVSRKGLIERIRRGRKVRARMVDSNTGETIAFQIRATREARGMTQYQLAETAGMSQNNLSRLESPEYGKQTVTSLKRIAEALDVALVVRFVPFSRYIDWLSGTPQWDEGISPRAMAVPDFETEEQAGQYTAKTLAFDKLIGDACVSITPKLADAANPKPIAVELGGDLNLTVKGSYERVA